MHDWMGLINLAFVVLLPIVPAYFLFRALPSEADVTGPLQGLTIKLGGAFAGYFALLVLVLSTHTFWNPPPVPASQTWDVEGQVLNDQGQPLESLNGSDILLNPNPVTPKHGGNFHVTFSTIPLPSGGSMYPTLFIGHLPEFPEAPEIHLDPDSPRLDSSLKLTGDKKTRHIQIQVVLKKTTKPYTSVGQPPPVVPPQ